MEQLTEKEMTFVEHLDELRTRLIVCLIALAVCAVAAYAFTLDALRLLLGKVGHLQYLGPADAFMMRIKLAMVMGLMLAAPVVLWQIWLFVAPGLKPVERRYAVPVVLSSCILFYSGVAFGLYAVPFSIRVLAQFGGNVMMPNYTVDRFLGFAVTIVLAFGGVFEMPLVFAFLAKLGIVSYKDLKTKRKYYYFGIMLAAAAIMPGDIQNMFILAIPLSVLFELSVFITRFIRPATV